MSWQDSYVEFDLSSLTYARFSAFFFDRQVVDDEEAFRLYSAEAHGADWISVSDPAIIITHLETMFRDFTALAKTYSHQQLEQGLWPMFGQHACTQYLFDPAVDPALRIRCVDAMYVPFRDVVAQYTGDTRDTFYWMWWDMILHELHPIPKEYKLGYVTLTDDQQQMVNAIFHTLTRILALDHLGCQLSALHGLGHLYHPLAEKVIQDYLDSRREQLPDADVEWIEGCRDNRIQ